MTYPDTVQLATLSPDGYGDKNVSVLTDCKANFIRRKGVDHNNNADGITSDAAVYLDPTNPIVVARLDDLEGLYVRYRSKWYSVSEAHVAERKLLNNAIDNIYCLLDKQAGVAYASYIS